MNTNEILSFYDITTGSELEDAVQELMRLLGMSREEAVNKCIKFFRLR